MKRLSFKLGTAFTLAVVMLVSLILALPVSGNGEFTTGYGGYQIPSPNLTSQGQPASYNYNSTTGQLTINVRVINDGGADAGSSTLGYYLSSDTTITTSDCKLGTDSVAALAPGAYSNETITINDICTIGCVSTGTWYVGFIIDETDTVTEDNEGDNTYYFTPSINVTCAPADAD